MKQDMIRRYTFPNGKELPFMDSGKIYLVTGEKKEILPVHINGFRYFYLNPSPSTFAHALNCLGHEIFRELASLLAFRFNAIARVRILGSGAIAWGEYWLCPEGVILNSEWIKHYAKDHDGDTCSLLLPDYLVKRTISLSEVWKGKTAKLRCASFMQKKIEVLWRIYPVTREPVTLIPASSAPVDAFFNFTEKECVNILADNAEKLGIPIKKTLDSVIAGYNAAAGIVNWDKVKTLWTDPQIGMVTSKLNIWELFCRKGKTLWQALETMYRHPIRHLAIEGLLKASRTKSDQLEAAVVRAGPAPFERLRLVWNKVPTRNNEGRLTLPIAPWVAPKTVSNLKGSGVNWIWHQKNIGNFFFRMLQCPISDSWFRALPKGVEEEEEFAPPVARGDATLIPRLIAAGILHVKELTHLTGIPCCQVCLTAPCSDGKWHMVAGIDEWRKDEFCDAVILYPVWDSRNDTLIHPLTNMAEWFSHIEDLVITRRSMGDSRPWSTNEIWNPQYATKRSILHKKVLEYFSVWGDNVRGSSTTGADYSRHVDPLIESTVSLRFWTDSVDEQIALAQRSGFRFNWAGAKSNHWFARKAQVCSSDGCPATAKVGCDYARAGKTRSQQVRTSHKQTLHVAIVSSTAAWQPWITPSGLEKMKADCFHSRLVSKDNPAAKPVSFFNIHGVEQMAYLASPKTTAIVPKLTDCCGNKFIPRQIGQVKQVIKGATVMELLGGPAAHEIDLLIPWQELAAKGCLHTFLDEGFEATIHIGKQEVKCIHLDWEFGRSAIPSENICIANNVDVLQGLDGAKYAQAFEAAGMGKREWFNPKDSDYVNKLHRFGIEVILENQEFYTPPRGFEPLR